MTPEQMAQEFIKIVSAKSKRYVYIVYIDSQGKKEADITYLSQGEKLNYQNIPQERDVYIGMFDRKSKSGRASACATTRMLWADYDGGISVEEVQCRIRAAKLPDPSLINKSGHGVHVYWALKRRIGPEALDIIKAIVAATGADPQAATLHQIMRIPGTLNHKTEPPCLCVTVGGVRKDYEPSEIADKVNACQGPEKPVQRRVELQNSLVIRRGYMMPPCVENILQGVEEGCRNASLGRLVKFLEQVGMQKDAAWQEIKDWNSRNQPPETLPILKKTFEAYSKEDYKLLGCWNNNQHEGALGYLQDFCEAPRCTRRLAIGKLAINTHLKINNRIFGMPDLKGPDFIVYTTILAADVMERRDLEETIYLSQRRIEKAVRKLKSKGLIEREEIIRPGDGKYQNYKVWPRQVNYGTGYTRISKEALMGAKEKIITPEEYRLYIYLCRYAQGKEWAHLSTPKMASILRVSQPLIVRNLKALTSAGYIVRVENNTDPQGAKWTILQI